MEDRNLDLDFNDDSKPVNKNLVSAKKNDNAFNDSGVGFNSTADLNASEFRINSTSQNVTSRVEET